MVRFEVSNEFRLGCLRPLLEKDVPGMLEWMHDDGVNAMFQIDFAAVDEHRALSFIESSRQSSNSLHLAIVDMDDDYLGTISLKNIDAETGCAEYAIATRRIAHGTGIAMRATQELLCYAFSVLGLRRVWLNVIVDNKRARRFYEKLGFIYEGLAREAIIISGQAVDLAYYSILSHEWNGASNKLQ